MELILTGLDGPKGRPSRADMGAAARRALPFPTLGAWYGGLQPHGPTSRPDGRDCGCGWGDLCTGVRIGTFSEVYSLCGATRYFPR